MTAKKYLQQIKALDIKIKQKMEEREDLYSRAISTGSRELKADVVQTSVNGDKVGGAIDRYVDLEKEIQTLIDRYIIQRNVIINQIQSIPDPRYEEILYLRYVKYMRLEEIACTMVKTNGQPYSYDHILRIHGEALKKFAEIM